MRVNYLCNECNKSSVCKYKDEQTKFLKELEDREDVPGVSKIQIICHYYGIDMGAIGTPKK